MNNIRKIIEERLDHAKMVYRNASEILELKGQIDAYQDCLNLMQPRTEQELIKEFEKLGWKVTQNDNGFIILCLSNIARIVILKQAKNYHINGPIGMQEHKLLNELFEVIF